NVDAHRHRRVFPGGNVRDLAVPSNQEPAGARFDAQCLQCDLGDLQELSFPTRQISGDPLGPNWHLHFLLLCGPAAHAGVECIGDWTGATAGDSVGPTAGGVGTYGVTGVAVLSVLARTLGTSALCAQLLRWVFVMRIVMIITSLVAYFITDGIFTAKYSRAEDF